MDICLSLHIWEHVPRSPSMPSWSLERESGNYKGSNLRAKLGKSQKTLAWQKGINFPRGCSQPRDQTQVSSSCRWILYQLSHSGSPRVLEWVAYPFSSGSSWPRNSTGVSCIAGAFFTNWAIRKCFYWCSFYQRFHMQELLLWPPWPCQFLFLYTHLAYLSFQSTSYVAVSIMQCSHLFLQNVK